MRDIYQPEDNPDAGWEREFKPEKVRRVRAEMIETRYGARYPEWVREIQAGQVKARVVLFWHLMNSEQPHFKMEDVPDYAFGEFEVDYGIADLQKLRRDVDESAMDDSTKADTLRRLDLEIATRLGKDETELTPADLGKDQPSESDASTS